MSWWLRCVQTRVATSADENWKPEQARHYIESPELAIKSWGEHTESKVPICLPQASIWFPALTECLFEASLNTPSIGNWEQHQFFLFLNFLAILMEKTEENVNLQLVFASRVPSVTILYSCDPCAKLTVAIPSGMKLKTGRTKTCKKFQRKFGFSLRYSEDPVYSIFY